MRLHSELRVSLKKFEQNLALVHKLASGQEITLMAKANAYGHGASELTRFAINECNIKSIGLAGVGEAAELKGMGAETYVFSGPLFIDQKTTDLIVELKCIPVISSMEDLAFFLDRPLFSSTPLCLKFNTGMNRLGLMPESLPLAVELLKKKGRRTLCHLMTHFSSSDQLADKESFTLKQLKVFQSLKSELKGQGINIEKTSVANSGAIVQGIASQETNIRPGLMAYGANPLSFKSSTPWEGKIISELLASIIDHRPVKAGELIGYGGTPCPRNGHMAILAIGYGDGVSKSWKGLKLSIEGVQGEVLGAVSMDMLAFFYQNERPQFKKGQKVRVWDSSQETFESIRTQLGLSPYELPLSINHRVPRTFTRK